jgi:hypothetical protein
MADGSIEVGGPRQQATGTSANPAPSDFEAYFNGFAGKIQSSGGPGDGAGASVPENELKRGEVANSQNYCICQRIAVTILETGGSLCEYAGLVLPRCSQKLCLVSLRAGNSVQKNGQESGGCGRFKITITLSSQRY